MYIWAPVFIASPPHCSNNPKLVVLPLLCLLLCFFLLVFPVLASLSFLSSGLFVWILPVFVRFPTLLLVVDTSGGFGNIFFYRIFLFIYWKKSEPNPLKFPFLEGTFENFLHRTFIKKRVSKRTWTSILQIFWCNADGIKCDLLTISSFEICKLS